MKIRHAKIGNYLYRLEMADKRRPCRKCSFQLYGLPCPMDPVGLHPTCIVWIDEIPRAGASWILIARVK